MFSVTLSGVIYQDNSTLLNLLYPVAALSKVWVCGRELAGIVGSNPIGGMDVCLL
jgi:hypothetical protein